MNLNKVFILGNLTRDPELRQIPSGQPVCSFAIATNRFYTDSAGQRQQQAEFHNVVAWGKQAEIVNQYVKKGQLLLIEGRLQTRSWLDPQGVKHWKTEVVAERIQLPPRQGAMGGEREVSGEGEQPYRPQKSQTAAREEPPMPTIELPGDGEEIDVKDIPF